MEQNTRLASKAVSIALEELGVKEATGHNDGPLIKLWLAFCGLAEGNPWCTSFASWCVYKAAAELGVKPIMPKSGSSTTLYAFARSHGMLLQAPEPFCIGLLKGNGGTPGKTHHHTFLVVAVDLAGGVVHGVDGNWHNAVTRTVHPIAACDFMAVA